MILVNVNELRPGQVLAADLLCNNEKHILLPKNTVLTMKHLHKLAEWKDLKIVIEDSKEQAYRIYKEVANSVDEVFNIIRQSGKPDLNNICHQSKQLVEEVLNNGSGILDQMFTLKNVDLYTFHHSVSVAVFSIILGNKLKYTKKQLKQLALGALLHDVGKAYIPQEILNKPGQLTEQEFSEVKEHTVYGYHLLSKIDEFDESVQAIPYQHHERIDGNGYPAKITGDEIHPFAKIVAITDIFSALTTNRVYRKKISPFSAAEYLMQLSGKALDFKLTKIFVNELIKVWEGAKVRLSDGRIATVQYVPESEPYKPTIMFDDGTTIKLRDEVDLYIESLHFEKAV